MVYISLWYKIFLLFFFSTWACITSGQAQTYTKEWDMTSRIVDDNLSEDAITDVAVDDKGNVYIIGNFSGTINLDPDRNETGKLSSNGKMDAFVAKYSADGKLMEKTNLDYQGNTNKALSIALKGDSVYIAGWGYYYDNDTDADAIIFLLDENLENLERILFANPSNEYARGIAIHSNGNVYITGDFEDNITINSVNKKVFDEGLFLAVYDEDLAFYQAGYVSEGAVDVETLAIALDEQGNAYVTGEFQGDFQISSEDKLINKSKRDIFITKFNISEGKLEYSKSISGTAEDRVGGITIGNNALYLTGNFQGDTDFNPSFTDEQIRTAITGTTGYEFDIFVAKYSLDATFQEVYTVGGISYEQGNEVKVHGEKVYLSGWIQSIDSMGESQRDPRFFKGIDTSKPEADFFLAVFDTELNNPDFVFRFGSHLKDFSNALDIDSDGNVYIGGVTDMERERDESDNPGSCCVKKETKNSYLIKLKALEEPTPLTITSVSPETNVKPKDTLTIVGTGFDGDLTVTIGSETAVIISQTSTTLKVTVPDNLEEGEYSLVITPKNGDAVTYKNKIHIIDDSINFTISDFDPKEGPSGTEVTISGQNLQDAKVTLNNAPVILFENSDTQIKFKIPEGSNTGQSIIKVEINNEIKTAGTFIVTSPPTVENQAPSLTIISSPPQYNKDEISISVEVKDDVGINSNSVILYYRGIRYPLRKEKLMVKDESKEDVYNIKLESSDISGTGMAISSFDDLGIRFYVKATDQQGREGVSEVKFIYKNYDNVVLQETSPISDSRRPLATDYQMISIPLTSDLSIKSLFSELGSYGAEENWRFFSFDPSREVFEEHKDGTGKTELGKGYMLAYRNVEEKINVKGNVASVGQDTSFTITLKPGYNLIGNPYTFPIDWSSIAKNYSGVSGLKRYSNVNSNTLKPFEGAFVTNNTTEDINITIPLSQSVNANLRLNESYTSFNNTDGWFVSISLESGELTNEMNGFGMHRKANLVADHFDDFTMPRFMDYLELNFHHPEFFLSKFSKDVVPLQESYVWKFEVASNLGPQITNLQWNSNSMIEDGKQLMLVDLQNSQVINMLEQQEYRFYQNGGSRYFQIYYGSHEQITEMMVPEQINVGAPYPNPAIDELSFPVAVPKSQELTAIKIDLFSSTGKIVTTLRQENIGSGFHIIRWNRQNQEGLVVPAGLYFYRIRLENEEHKGKILLQ